MKGFGFFDCIIAHNLSTTYITFELHISNSRTKSVGLDFMYLIYRSRALKSRKKHDELRAYIWLRATILLSKLSCKKVRLWVNSRSS